MKNNYKIKMICLLCAITAAFGSCKKSEVDEVKGLTNNHNKLAITADGKWDLLGYGYDMTGELFSPSNASDAAIIDVDKFNSDYPNRINTPTDTYGYYAVYSGATAYDYVKDVNSKETFGASSTGGDPASGIYGSSNFSKTNENQSTYTYNSKYSYATYESKVRIKSINFTGDATLDLLRNYLTPLFITNLSNYSADALVERYGTHVLLGISIGGRLKYDYRGAIVKETTYERKLRAAKASISIGVAKIFGVTLSSDVSNEEKITIANENTDRAYIGTYYGGTNSGSSFTADPEGRTSQSVNLAGWQQSITVNNATLIEINKSVPIYELIVDPVKKQQVKDAVEKYIRDRQISLLPTVLYEYYNGVTNRHAYSLRDDMQGLWSNYYRNAEPFKAFSTPYNGAVPLYQFYDQGFDNRVLTTNRNPGLSTYRYDGIICYVYTTNVPGSVPVYEFYNPSGGHLYTTNRNTSFAGWRYNGQPFYAFPN